MEAQTPVSVAIVGPFSSGKSTLLNALVGETVQSMGVLPETSMLSHRTWGPSRAGRIHMADGRIVEGSFEEIKARITELEHSGGAGAVDHVEHAIPQNFLQHLHLWDTPGLNSTYLHHEIVAERAIRTADIILWVTPVDAAVTREEVEKIAKRKPPRTPLLIVINKIDVAEEAELVDALAGIRKDLDGLATVVQPAAARAALDKASGAVPEFLGDDGLAELRQAIVSYVVAVQTERARARAPTVKGRLGPSEFECPHCSEVCDLTDLFCICGRELSDQWRECSRCGATNTLRRPRCRRCNVAIATAEESDALERLALDDLAELNLSAAAAKLMLSAELDSAVAGRLNLARAIESCAERLHDLVVAAALALQGSGANWLDEALRAETLVATSDLKSRVSACAVGAVLVTEGQRRRRDLFAAWRCNRSPFEVVLLGVAAELERCLVEAWHRAATMEPAAAAQASARLLGLSVDRAACEVESRMGLALRGPWAEARAAVVEVLQGGVRIRLACEAIVGQEFENALEHLMASAFNSEMRDNLGGLVNRCQDLCVERDSRDAHVLEAVKRCWREGEAAVACGDLCRVWGLIEEADGFIPLTSRRHRETIINGIRGLEFSMRSAEAEAQSVTKQAEGCDDREQFEGALELLKRAAGIDRRLLPRAERYEEGLARNVCARDRLQRIEKDVECGELLRGEEGLAELEAGWKMDGLHSPIAGRRATGLRRRVDEGRTMASQLLESGNEKARDGQLMDALVDLICARAIDSALQQASTKSVASILWRLRTGRAGFIIAVCACVLVGAVGWCAAIGMPQATLLILRGSPVAMGVFVCVGMLVAFWSAARLRIAASRKAIETLEKWGRAGSAEAIRAEAGPARVQG